MLACMYAVSCTSPFDDEVKTPVQDEQEVPQESPDQSEDQNQENSWQDQVCEAEPPWSLGNPILLSDNLILQVYKKNESGRYPYPISPSEMELIFFKEGNGIDYMHHIHSWLNLEEDEYYKLIDNVKTALSHAPNPNESFLSYATYIGIIGIAITADKTLFGRAPGEDLSDKFMISNFEGSQILLSYPDAQVLKGYYDDKTMTVADWSQMGGMFYSFRTHYTELPEETYSEVTFTMVIDTTDERTFTGSVKVSFK